jgi:hypothetical protein
MAELVRVPRGDSGILADPSNRVLVISGVVPVFGGPLRIGLLVVRLPGADRRRAHFSYPSAFVLPQAFRTEHAVIRPDRRQERGKRGLGLRADRYGPPPTCVGRLVPRRVIEPDCAGRVYLPHPQTAQFARPHPGEPLEPHFSPDVVVPVRWRGLWGQKSPLQCSCLSCGLRTIRCGGSAGCSSATEERAGVPRPLPALRTLRSASRATRSVHPPGP